MKVLRYTNFESNEFGNGAEKRTAQIGEILDKSDILSFNLKKRDSKNISLYIVFFNLFRAVILFRKIVVISKFKGIKRLLRAIKNYVSVREQLTQPFISNTRILLWECSRSENFYIPILAKKIGKKIIALTHNLESLVPNQTSTISNTKSPDWFSEEISYLSKCDSVFCISREETWLLRLFKINAFYLPYYPTESTIDFLLEIRKKRLTNQKTGSIRKILMFGSADNQPTKIGMIDRLKVLRNSSSGNFQLIIAGYNTHLLLNEIVPSEKFIFLGPLEKDQLLQQFIEVDAVLIHQPPTSGALIKIPEMLIAGIPIIGNSNSVRSYNYDGIYSYDDDYSFFNIISNQDLSIPPIPDRPTEQINLFISTINSLV